MRYLLCFKATTNFHDTITETERIVQSNRTELHKVTELDLQPHFIFIIIKSYLILHGPQADTVALGLFPAKKEQNRLCYEKLEKVKRSKKQILWFIFEFFARLQRNCCSLNIKQEFFFYILSKRAMNVFLINFSFSLYLDV